MRILTRYVGGGFLVAFSMTLMVITFVMCIGIMFKVTDLIARGVPWEPILRMLGYGMPQALTYSIPVSTLTACLLVFGRLSADGEISAMRASGVNLWSVVKMPLLFAAAMSLVCVLINNEVMPRSHLAGREELSRLGMQTPLQLLEEGRFIQDFPGFTLYVGKRKGDTLRNVRIYDLRKPGLRREVRATSGTVREDNGGLALDLQDVRIDPFADDRPGAAYCEQWTVRIPKREGKGGYRPDEDDMAFLELVRAIRHVRERYPQLDEQDLGRQETVLRVELHKRMSLSLACFGFAMLGVPLGIRSHRKESSVGIGISLLLVVNLYVFIIVAESLDKRPALHPHWIVWIPIVLAVVIGTHLIRRNN